MAKEVVIKALPKDPGPCAWNSILGEDTPYPQFTGETVFDWVVVGGGFAGIAAARRLSQLVDGESIALLEAGRVAEGAAGRNSGFMIDLPHELNSETYAGAHESDLRQIRLNRSAIQFAKEMAEEFGMGRDVFNPCGKVTAAGSKKGEAHIQSYLKHLETLGETFEMRTASQMKDWTGSGFYTLGLYTPGAVMIQPAQFVREAARGISNRVSIFERSPVTRMKLGSTHELFTGQGKVRARNIILAVNGAVQHFGYFPKRLLHVYTYASMTRQLTQSEVKALGGARDWAILPADPMGTTVRRTSGVTGGGDRIVIRNHATLNQSFEVSSANMARAKKLQDRSFENRFPMLKGVDMEYRWGGRLCLTWNSVPAFGEIDDRVWSACCQNGLGTVKGTLSGMMAAELAVLGTSSTLSEFLIHNEPKALPPEPFLSLGANTTMRWKEFQAGIEL